MEEKKDKKTEEVKETVSRRERNKNLEEARKKSVILYLIPLVALVIIAIIYIPTHQNWLLVPFAILMFVALFGHDGASRTCPYCKKWNAVVYTTTKNYTKTITEESKDLFGKTKKKTRKEKTKKFFGECSNCKVKVDTEKKRYF